MHLNDECFIPKLHLCDGSATEEGPRNSEEQSEPGELNLHPQTMDFSPKNGGFFTEKRWILHRKTVDFALNTVDSLLEITNSDGVATREAEGRGRENHHLKCKFHHFKCKFHQF